MSGLTGCTLELRSTTLTTMFAAPLSTQQPEGREEASTFTLRWIPFVKLNNFRTEQQLTTVLGYDLAHQIMCCPALGLTLNGQLTTQRLDKPVLCTE